MFTRKYANPANLWIRLAVGSGLLALICLQCTPTSELGGGDGLVTAAFASTAGEKAPGVKKLENLAKSDPVALLDLCLSNYEQRIQSYTCTFIKRERIDGDLGKAQTINVHFLDEPFSVAMVWTENAPISDRALYVENKHDGYMLVKPKGFLSLVGTVRRKPEAEEVMDNTLRPITMFGFRRTLQELRKVYIEAAENGDLSTRYVGQKSVAGRRAIVIERTLPNEKQYPAAKTHIYIDTELLVPICVEAWNWDGDLSSRYIYTDIELNVGLTPADFKPEKFGM